MEEATCRSILPLKISEGSLVTESTDHKLQLGSCFWVQEARDGTLRSALCLALLEFNAKCLDSNYIYV